MTDFVVERREGLRGEWKVQHIGARPHWPLKPEPGNAVRVTRVGRKPLPRKLSHSVRPSRASGEVCSAWSIHRKAALMAAHIKRTGQTVIPLYAETRAAWPSGVPSSVREFNAALLRELSEEYTTPEGWRRLRLPERYTVVHVDPRDDVREELGE